MGAHSGRVFRTVLCGRRRGEWRRSLACRQTGVFRHGWIRHTQDDSVHSRARDVLRERDRIFGGLGLHPHKRAVGLDAEPEFDVDATQGVGLYVRSYAHRRRVHLARDGVQGTRSCFGQGGTQLRGHAVQDGGEASFRGQRLVEPGDEAATVGGAEGERDDLGGEQRRR